MMYLLNKAPKGNNIYGLASAVAYVIHGDGHPHLPRFQRMLGRAGCREGGARPVSGWMYGILIALAVLALWRGSKRSRAVSKFSLYLVLSSSRRYGTALSTGCSVLSTRFTPEIYSFPPPFTFGSALADNFQFMNENVKIVRHFMNSLFVTSMNTFLVLLFCSMGGYAFAIYRFPGRNALFAILLGTMMVPQLAGIVPWFFLITKFGWLNNYAALIVPGAANAFGIYWMRQYCVNNVPSSLMEAAKIDGCSEWLIFFRVIAPVLLPAFAALGIMQFVNVWNDFMVPMLVLRENDLFTLPLMLSYMRGDPSRGANVAR
jgi:ABC-type glycerol-3-phosphate transport system permease component